MASDAPEANRADTEATDPLTRATARPSDLPPGSRVAAEATTEKGSTLGPPAGTSKVSVVSLKLIVTSSSLDAGQMPSTGIGGGVAAGSTLVAVAPGLIGGSPDEDPCDTGTA
jgi:hypothetical protein